MADHPPQHPTSPGVVSAPARSSNAWAGSSDAWLPRLPVRPLISLLLSLLLLLLLIQPAIAASLDRTQAIELAQQRQWLSLLHLDHGHSTVVSPDFYLSSTASPDTDDFPVAELMALAAQIDAEINTKADAHVRCRFPARSLWLAERVGLQLEPMSCPAFEHWSNADKGGIDSVSMMFVAGHFRSPASFFGHNFLKFNTPGARADEVPLQPVINYGAEVPEGESPLRYITRGIWGGYNASFSRDQFFRLHEKYAERELRDIWEYPLNLTPAEVALLVAHAWELNNRDVTYYFFKENCAYQIAALVNLVIGQPLVPEKLPWSLPYTVFERLARVTHHGRPLVGELRYYPSRKSRYEQRFHALGVQGQALVRHYLKHGQLRSQPPALIPGTNPRRNSATAADASTAQAESPTGASDKTAAGVRKGTAVTADTITTLAGINAAAIDTLLDFYQYRAVSGRYETAEKQRQQLLLQRLQLPAANHLPGQQQPTESPGNSHSPTRPVAPHHGQKPTVAGLALVHNNQVPGSHWRLRLRPAYYDLLNLSHGRLPFSSFALVDTTVRWHDDRLSLEQLTLFDILNLNPPTVGMSRSDRLAWGLSLGAGRAALDCIHCVIPRLRLRLGRAWNIATGLAGYALGGVEIRESWHGSGHLALRPEIGITGRLASWWQTSVSLVHQRYLDGSQAASSIAHISNRFGSSRSVDIRIDFAYDRALETSIAGRWYF